MITEVTRPTSIWQRFALGFDVARPGYASGHWFTMNAVVDLRGPLDTSRLERAFRELVSRHDLLRSRIVQDGPVQIVRSDVTVELERIDDGDTAWLHAPVAFDSPSPIRLRLARVERDRHMLCLHLHHLMADPVTLWTLLDELAALYRGPLPAPQAQFWQYAEEQTRLMEADRAADQAWWNIIADVSAFASPAPTSERDFARRQRVLDPGQLTTVERFSREHRSTMFVSLLAGFACAMLPYVGAGDCMLFTTLFSRRNRAEWRTLPGPCTVPAYLPLPRPPAQLSGEYATAVRDVVVAAQRHSRFPTGDVSALHPDFSNAVTPFIEYLPDSRPVELSFGEATGTVAEAAGPRDIGRAGALGIRARRTSDGELFAHLSGNGVGWTEERTLDVCRTLHWAAEPIASEVS
jgi:hypothetical protein